MRQGSGGYVQNFKSIRQKIKIFILGVIISGALGGGGLDCSQYHFLTEPRNGLKNLCGHFGYDRSYRLGGVWWQTDRQTDDSKQTDRQTDRQTYSRQTDRKFESLCALWYLRLLRRLDNKVDVQFQYILVWKLHTQACEIVARIKRKQFKKFQVNICKPKKR